MQTISRVIVSFVYYDSLIRDTLEYTLGKESYDVNFYNYKRNGIVNELKLNTPLKNFIEKNGENGEKLKALLEKFGEDFYSDNSTVIHLAQDGLRVDNAQNNKIFTAVVPAHQQMLEVVRIHVAYAHEHQAESNLTNDDLAKLDTLRDANNRFFTAVAYLSLTRETFKQFDEFNKAMRESQGQRTPQSNFIEQQLNELNQMLNLSRALCTANDTIYTDASDALFQAVEMMNGRRQLPAGKNFNDVMNDVNAKVGAFVRDAEEKYRAVYGPLLQELIEDSRKQREAQEGAAPVENAN